MKYSDCCSAPVTMQDMNGHGKCTDCGENCTTVEDLRHPYQANPLALAFVLFIFLFFLIG